VKQYLVPVVRTLMELERSSQWLFLQPAEVLHREAVTVAPEVAAVVGCVLVVVAEDPVEYQAAAADDGSVEVGLLQLLPGPATAAEAEYILRLQAEQELSSVAQCADE